jgi:putative ABC transport system permease protein
MMQTLWQDLRYALRMLEKSPGFTAVAIFTLALGIGANTAIFQLLDAVRLRTLPVKNPEQIAKVSIDHRNGASGSFTSRYADLTYAQWEQIRGRQQGFSSVFAWGPNLFNISPSGEVHNVQGLWVSGEFFQTLGVEPVLGRVLTTADDGPNCASPGAVISYSFWKHTFAGENSVIGKTLLINRHPFPIVGVTPADFYGVEVGRYFDVAVPLCAEPIIEGEDSQLHRADGWWLSVMGRLKPGWTIKQAALQLRSISPGIFEATVPPTFNTDQAKHYAGYILGAFPGGSGASTLRRDFENPLWFLLALAALVLLIASANLANLMLARASTREKEMGMRMAVGASRARLIRQLLTENLLLAGMGAVLGGLLAHSLSQILVAFLSTQNDPLFVDLGTDWRVLGFSATLACSTCILFGLAPALRSTSVAPGVVLKESGRGTTEGRSPFSLRRILVVSQIALSLTLLVSALLFAGSLNNLAKVDAGFRPEGILIADIDFTALNLSNQRRLSFAGELLNQVRASPGVDAAAIAEIVPLSGNGENHDLLMGSSGEPKGERPVVAFNRVSPDFFRTLQTPMLAGRDFDDHDVAGAPYRAIVTEEFAREFAGGRNPVGMTFRIGRMRTITPPYEIIGLVKNSKYSALRDEPEPIIYTCTAQYDHPNSDAQILIRANGPVAGLLAGVKNAANAIHPDLDINFYAFDTMIQNGLLRDRLMAALSGFFGVLAAVLAAIGLYGVISYIVTTRRSEIGIRMALGASRTDVVRTVLRQTLLLLVCGVAIGVVLALAVGRSAGSLLFGLKPHDPSTFVAASALLLVVGLIAGFVPVYRASRLDPMVALRHE